MIARWIAGFKSLRSFGQISDDDYNAKACSGRFVTGLSLTVHSMRKWSMSLIIRRCSAIPVWALVRVRKKWV